MSDGENGNVVNLHMNQNDQDGEVGVQSGSKYQNERKRKMLRFDKVFQATRTTL